MPVLGLCLSLRGRDPTNLVDRHNAQDPPPPVLAWRARARRLMDLSAIEAEVARLFPALAADSSGLEFAACVLADICMAGDHVAVTDVASVLTPMLEGEDESGTLAASAELLGRLVTMPGADVATAKPAGPPPVAEHREPVAAATAAAATAASSAARAPQPSSSAGASAAAAGSAAAGPGGRWEEAASAGAAGGAPAAPEAASLGFPALTRCQSVTEFRTPALEEELRLASDVCSAGDAVFSRKQDELLVEFPIKVYVSRLPPGAVPPPSSSSKPAKKPFRAHVAVASLALLATEPPSDRRTPDSCRFAVRRNVRIAVNAKIGMSNVEASAAAIAMTRSETAQRAQRAADGVARAIHGDVLELVANSGTAGWLADVVALVEGRMQQLKEQVAGPGLGKSGLMKRDWGDAPKSVAPPLIMQAAQVPTAHSTLHYSVGGAGFAFGGSNFVHGGDAIYPMWPRLLLMDSVSELKRCASALAALCLPHGGHVPAASLPAIEPFKTMLAKGVTFRQLLGKDGRCLDRKRIGRVFASVGAMRDDEQLLQAEANLTVLARFQVREPTAALMAMVPAAGGRYTWAVVPTKGESDRYSSAPALSEHAVVPMGPNSAIVIGEKAVWRLRLVRARHERSGWQASWRRIGTVETGVRGAAAVRVPGSQAVCLVGSASADVPFLRVLTWHFDMPALAAKPNFEDFETIRNPSASTAGNLLLVFGGAKGASHSACNDLHVIDMNRWMPVDVILADNSAPAPLGRWSHAAGCFLGAGGLCLAVYGGTAGSRVSGELLLGDMRVAELAGLAMDDSGCATSVQVCWREALLKDETVRASFRCAGLARAPAKTFVPLRSSAASLTQGRLVMFGGMGATPHGELPLPGFVAARFAPLRTTFAVRVGFTPVKIAASSYVRDLAVLLADALGKQSGDGAGSEAPDRAAPTEEETATSGVLPEVELQPEEGPVVRVHAAILFAAAPSLRAAMLEACSRRSSRIRFTPVTDEASGETHNQLIVTPVLDETGGAVPLPELSGDYFVASTANSGTGTGAGGGAGGEDEDEAGGGGDEDAAAAGELLRLADWTALEGGPLVVPVDAEGSAVKRVVEFMYTRGGKVRSSDTSSVTIACEQLDLAPAEALSAAEELGWRWTGKAVPGAKDVNVAWAADEHGHCVATDLRLFKAAAAAEALQRASFVEAGAVPKAGDRTLRRSLGALLSGKPLTRLQAAVAHCRADEPAKGGATAPGDDAASGRGSASARAAPAAAAATATATAIATATAASAAASGAGGRGRGVDGDEEAGSTEAAERAAELAYERSLRALLPKWGDFWTLGADAAVRIGEGVLVPCHRSVLAARSVFFRGAFACGMSEAEDGVLSVGLDGLPAAAGLSLLAYLYSDAAPADVDPDLAVPLIRLATLHVLPRLRTRCEQAILEGFDFSDPESLAGLWEFVHCLGSAPRLLDVVISGMHAFPSSIIIESAESIGVSPSLMPALRKSCKRL
ncbi:hypothetical protein FNF31_03016 [Cafeteria roenbergensis]|uniref:BTB domain-containing protein n=1 Tax=Cafeteria roenbergensis TaxID=33653 RepID=A0A5A8DFF9_CAFRO|nr:hypothetical protein FNF31_03016 [Cafeteria roenbergensis]